MQGETKRGIFARPRQIQAARTSAAQGRFSARGAVLLVPAAPRRLRLIVCWRRWRQRDRVLKLDAMAALAVLPNEMAEVLAERALAQAGKFGRLAHEDLPVPFLRRQRADVGGRCLRIHTHKISATGRKRTICGGAANYRKLPQCGDLRQFAEGGLRCRPQIIDDAFNGVAAGKEQLFRIGYRRRIPIILYRTN
jgi:hypothetical protein